jgi:hypothetical protein
MQLWHPEVAAETAEAIEGLAVITPQKFLSMVAVSSGHPPPSRHGFL